MAKTQNNSSSRTITTSGSGFIPSSPDIIELLKSELKKHPDRTEDILYRIISLGNSEGTKYDRNLLDVVLGVYDSMTDKPMQEDRYTGSWQWKEEGLKPNPDRDWNLLFAKGNVKGQYLEIPKEKLRGINLNNQYPSYYGNFIPKKEYTITDNYSPLLQYLANHNLGGQVYEDNEEGGSSGIVRLPFSETEYLDAVKNRYTVDNVGRFNVSVGINPTGNPEILFYDFGNFGKEYGDTYGGSNASLQGELLDTFGHPFHLRLYVPINTISTKQFNLLPKDSKWEVEDMNRALLDIAEANKVPVMLYSPNTDTYGTVHLPEVIVNGNKKAEGGLLDTPPDWNELSMKDRAAYIRMGVANGYRDINSIRLVYNEFKKGGPKKKKDPNILKLEFLNNLELSLEGYSRYATPEWKRLLTELAFKESSYYPNVTNSIGAKGYFQLMPFNRSSTWSTPILLFHEMYKLTDANMKYLRNTLTEKDLKKALSMGIDIYGLIAGAHLGGVDNAIKALRGLGNAKDMNNSSVFGYMKLFSLMHRLPVILDSNKVYIEPIIELPDAIRVSPIINTLIELSIPVKLDSIDYEQSVPEVIVTPDKPKYIIPDDEVISLIQSLIKPPTLAELPKPFTATERLKEINNNRVTFLLKDLEDSIIRNNLLGIQNPDKLRRDAEDLRFYRNMSALGGNLFEGGGYTKTYIDGRGKEVTFHRFPNETDEQYEARYAERAAIREGNAAINKARYERRRATNEAGAARLNRAINTVTNVMEEQAKATPFTGQEIQQAAEEQRQEKLDKWRDYKKGINATITAAELGLSGASLLGAYANWKNWATAANATKRGIANLLQRAQLPMQIGGTLIDGYQTYDALQNNDNFNANYNGASTGLGVAGSVGASDVFLNSRYHNPRIDRILDVLGIIQNGGDFIKFGYDAYMNNKKSNGGNLYPIGGPMITVNSGDRVDTDLCAEWSNGLLRDNGYLISGNAWALNHVDSIFNGYDGLVKPESYDSRLIADYNHAATGNVFKNFDSKTLDTSRPYVVNMYYNNSPALETAYNEGDNVTGTHTGLLTYDEPTKKWWVTHNIHGNIHLEPFIDLQNSKGKYGVTAIYAPRKNTLWNRTKGFFGFSDGGYLNTIQ